MDIWSLSPVVINRKEENILKKEECLVATAEFKTTYLDTIATIYAGIENGIAKIEVFPECLNNMYQAKFGLAYNSRRSCHNYLQSGDIHLQPTYDCLYHILTYHLFERDPLEGLDPYNLDLTWIEKLISIELPEGFIPHKHIYDIYDMCQESISKKEECLVATAKFKTEELETTVTIYAGIENGIAKIEVEPKILNNFYQKKFRLAYSSRVSCHGYIPSGDRHNQPTYDCLYHILTYHLFEKNPSQGLYPINEDLDRGEELISIELPEGYIPYKDIDDMYEEFKKFGENNILY